jgi:hypothetical protein
VQPGLAFTEINVRHTGYRNIGAISMGNNPAADQNRPPLIRKRHLAASIKGHRARWTVDRVLHDYLRIRSEPALMIPESVETWNEHSGREVEKRWSRQRIALPASTHYTGNVEFHIESDGL